MSTLTPDISTRALHEQALHLIAQRWVRSGYCKVAIRPAGDAEGWSQFRQVRPDLVGWQYSDGRQRLEWIAEVETKESLGGDPPDSRWRREATLGLPFFLFVPRGCRGEAQELAMRAGVKLNGIYEYSFINDMLQLL